MTEEIIKLVENIISHQFGHNKALLQQAFTFRSYTEENPKSVNNEVLELIGDAVINLYVMKALVEKYAKEEVSEGTLTHMRSKIVCGKNLARNCDRLELANPKWLLLGKGSRLREEFKLDKIKEDLLESIVGAIAINCDYDSEELDIVVRHLLDLEHLESENNQIQGLIYGKLTTNKRTVKNIDNENAINYLQESWKAKKISQPLYIDLGLINGRWAARAEIPELGLWCEEGGKSKKGAKLNAAQKLYEEIVRKQEPKGFIRQSKWRMQNSARKIFDL